MPFHVDFLARLADELNALAVQGQFPTAALTNGGWNKYSWLHARVWAAMTRSVPAPLTPMLDVRWNANFKADLCAVRANDQTAAVIEYESTNSSDERVLLKDLAHFEAAIREYAGAGGEPLPECWLVVTSLVDGPVTRWPWYSPGYNSRHDAPPAAKSRQLRDANPDAYYAPGYVAEFAAAWQRIVAHFGSVPPTNLVWANLGLDGIRVRSHNGVAVQQPLFPLQLP
jgi:hypothetical protein